MAVLDRIPAFDRVALHLRVLDHLRNDPAHCADYVLLRITPKAPDRAKQYLSMRRSRRQRPPRRGAHREAAAQYRRALRFGAQLPPARRARLLEGLAQSSFLAGQARDNRPSERVRSLFRGDRFSLTTTLRA
jgi:hypothetical protein